MDLQSFFQHTVASAAVRRSVALKFQNVAVALQATSYSDGINRLMPHGSTADKVAYLNSLKDLFATVLDRMADQVEYEALEQALINKLKDEQ